MSRYSKEEQAKRNEEHQKSRAYSELIGKLIGAMPLPEHTINIHAIYLEKTIEDYVRAENLNLVPDFQRGHVWTEAQQIAFSESLIRQTLNESGRIITFNSAQSAKHQHGDTDMDCMVCIDGLQRLTAIRRLINKEFKVFAHIDGGVYWDFFNNTRYNLLSVHNGLIFQIMNLPYKADVLAYYLSFNGAGTPHSEAEIERVRAMLSELERAKNEK